MGGNSRYSVLSLPGMWAWGERSHAHLMTLILSSWNGLLLWFPQYTVSLPSYMVNSSVTVRMVIYMAGLPVYTRGFSWLNGRFTWLNIELSVLSSCVTWLSKCACWMHDEWLLSSNTWKFRPMIAWGTQGRGITIIFGIRKSTVASLMII